MIIPFWYILQASWRNAPKMGEMEHVMNETKAKKDSVRPMKKYRSYKLMPGRFDSSYTCGYYAFSALKQARAFATEAISFLGQRIGYAKIYYCVSDIDGDDDSLINTKETLVETIKITYNGEDCFNYVPFAERRLVTKIEKHC